VIVCSSSVVDTGPLETSFTLGLPFSDSKEVLAGDLPSTLEASGGLGSQAPVLSTEARLEPELILRVQYAFPSQIAHGN
jgi:hypothetical protein